MKYTKIKQVAYPAFTELELYEFFLDDLFDTFLKFYSYSLADLIEQSKLAASQKTDFLCNLEVAYEEFSSYTQALSIQQKNKLAVKTSIYFLNRDILAGVREHLFTDKSAFHVTSDLKITATKTQHNIETALATQYFLETTSKYKNRFESDNKELMKSIKKLIK